MDARNYSSAREAQLAQELSGLNHRLAETAQANSPHSRCVASYLKQLAKNKRDKLAALRYERLRVG